MAYGYFNDLPKRTFADKIFCDKAFEIAKNGKYYRYQRGLASVLYKYFDKKTSGGAVKIAPNKELANKLHKPIVRKFVKQKVH